MQNKTFRNFIGKLIADGKVASSTIGDSIRRSSDFETLINGGFIEHQPAVTGGGSYYVRKHEALQSYYSSKFPGEQPAAMTAISNVNAFRNSKAAKRESQNIVLLRGYHNVLLNGIDVDLRTYTSTFGTFSGVLTSLDTPMVCLVENLDCYLLAEKVIGQDYVFVHTYGGLGKGIVSKMKANRILVFADYDFIGLHNFLLVKSVFEATELFIPPDYEALVKSRSRTIKTKDGREQQPSKLVLESTDKAVLRIRNCIFETRQYLEQQALFR
jgi:hypothetical protein